ncbi:hypothetical protein MMC29_003509 [Sticta canariensis]|nr:hypothetical protein [Sticta canariensis]
MTRTKFLELTAVCLIFSSPSSATALLRALDAVDVIGLLPRAANSCSVSNFQPCGQMPANFCCPSGSTCLVFNNAASVVCCPSGQDCKTIEPINCDITQQNATLHPSNPLHSTDLGGSLETCGSGGSSCCPRGFSCQNQQCIIKAGSSSSSAVSSTSKPSTSSTKSASVTSAPSSASSSKAPSQTSSIPNGSASLKNGTAVASCDRFPAVAVLAGFFPGLLLGVLLAVLTILCLGRRRKSHHSSSDFGSVAATVSDPIYHPENNALRTDFLRRGSGSKNRTSRVKSLFSRSPTIGNASGFGRNISSPIKTPEMRKEPSTESIKIYSPPNGGLDRPATTFADMMADAGLEPGRPFLQSPARIYPRGRGPGES